MDPNPLLTNGWKLKRKRLFHVPFTLIRKKLKTGTFKISKCTGQTAETEYSLHRTCGETSARRKHNKNNDNNKRMTLFICSLGIQGLNLNASKSMLKVGSVIVISCTVIGGPISLNITWFKEGEKIVLSHRRKITTVEHQSRLTIRNVMAQDEGEYHCRAR